MTLSATALRANLYKVLDEVLATGVPVEIERRGRSLKIVLEETVPVSGKLKVRPEFIRGNPDDLVHMDWSDTWNP